MRGACSEDPREYLFPVSADNDQLRSLRNCCLQCHLPSPDEADWVMRSVLMVAAKSVQPRTGMVILSVRAGPHLLERLCLWCRLDLAPRTVAHNLLHRVRLGQQGCQANELLQPRLVLLV